MGGPQFDSFLSHPHDEAEWVESLARRLEDEVGLRVWLDKWILVPGEHWQQAMAKGLEEAKSCCVIVGAAPSSGWFAEEVQRALSRQAKEPSYRVIPVIAPSGSTSNIPPFVELRTWADFRAGQDEAYAFHVLTQGIKGLPVGRWSPTPSPAETLSQRRARVRGRLAEIAAVADLLPEDVVRHLQLKTMNDHLEGDQ